MNETTLELNFVQSILMHFHVNTFVDFKLYYFKFIILRIKLDRMIFLAGLAYLSHISWLFARPQVKTLIVKFKLLPGKGVSLNFFLWFLVPFLIQITQYCGNLSKVVGATLSNTDYPILWKLKQSCWTTLPTSPLFKQVGW